MKSIPLALAAVVFAGSSLTAAQAAGSDTSTSTPDLQEWLGLFHQQEEVRQADV